MVEGDELTAADKELLENLRRRNVRIEREGIYRNGRNQADPEGRNKVGGREPGAELPEPGQGGDGAGADGGGRRPVGGLGG